MNYIRLPAWHTWGGEVASAKGARSDLTSLSPLVRVDQVSHGRGRGDVDGDKNIGRHTTNRPLGTRGQCITVQDQRMLFQFTTIAKWPGVFSLLLSRILRKLVGTQNKERTGHHSEPHRFAWETFNGQRGKTDQIETKIGRNGIVDVLLMVSLLPNSESLVLLCGHR